jgi:hypothetical protein
LPSGRIFSWNRLLLESRDCLALSRWPGANVFDAAAVRLPARAAPPSAEAAHADPGSSMASNMTMGRRNGERRK